MIKNRLLRKSLEVSQGNTQSDLLQIAIIYKQGQWELYKILYTVNPKRNVYIHMGNHSITEPVRLEKTSKIMKSNHQPITTMPPDTSLGATSVSHTWWSFLKCRSVNIPYSYSLVISGKRWLCFHLYRQLPCYLLICSRASMADSWLIPCLN